MIGHVSAPHDVSMRPSFRSVPPTVHVEAPATDKQLAFLEKLQEQRVVSVKLQEDIHWEYQQPTGPTKRVVSDLIDDLLAQPFKRSHQAKHGPTQPPLPDVPEGRYAVEGVDGRLRFLRVDKPSDGPWAGWTFVAVQASDEFHRLKGDQPAKAIAKILEAGPREASLRYGRELGKCGVCGRTLTDENSREAGIGPTCASKSGW